MKKYTSFLLLIFLAFFCIVLAGCTEHQTISWYDGDTLLYQTIIDVGDPLPSYDLPDNNENSSVRYTGWKKKVVDDNNIEFYTITEPNKYTVSWYDGGALLHQESVVVGEEVPSFNLPLNSADSPWVYKGWEQQNNEKDITYYIIKEPNKDYFSGNVFQIAIQDLGEQTIALGSGVIINSEGWFITNYHVMEDAYYAKAMFEISNTELGISFTTLDILQVGYGNADKDIFIGKVDNYSSIKQYYHDIAFSTEHAIGNITYSIGYPNGTPYMQINEGVEVDLATSINDKLLSGVQYIGSTSYIMPGSSGGVLLNSNLEIIGLTTIVETLNDEFLESYSISTFNFKPHITNITDYTLQGLVPMLHPEYEEYVHFFNTFGSDPDFSYSLNEGIVSYTYKTTSEDTNDNNVAYIETHTFIVQSDMFIEYEWEYVWENGDTKRMVLVGIWSPTTGIDNLCYIFYYEFSDGNYYNILSTNINYSSNLSLTLNNYSSTDSGVNVTDSNIEYAKQNFNSLYERLTKIWDMYSQD